MATTHTSTTTGVESPSGTATVGPHAAPAYAWQSLYVGLVATYLSLVLVVAYYTWGSVFAPLADTASVFIALAFVPVAWTLHRILSVRSPTASGAALAVLGVGVLVSLVGSISLITTGLDLVTITAFTPLAVQILGLGIIGVWMAVVGILGRQYGVFRGRIAGAAIVGGLGYASTPVLVAVFGLESGAIWSTSVFALAGFTLFAIWLARAFRSGALTMDAAEGTPSHRFGW